MPKGDDYLGDNTYLRSQRLSLVNRLLEPRGSDFLRIR
jgi:hypothetical protein